MITSRSTSSPGILFSTSPEEMSLLPLTPSSVTHQPSMMVVPWPNSLLEETPWYVMPMASKVKNNSSIPYTTISDSMTTLITDGGRYEISKKVADLLRSLFIKQYESEPYHQHQNKAEQRYGVVKRYINTLMNLTGAPAHCWLLCMLYVCNLLNATASPALGGLTPLQALTGQVPDISHFLHFSFWEPIYYKVDESEPDHRFPSQSNEKRGHWVGFADNKGDHLTWKILTDDTNTIIIRSAVRSATKTSPNLRLDPPKGEDQPQDLTSDVFVYGRPNPDGSDNTPPMSIINFDDLLGRTFLLPMDENGERKRATISEHVNDLCQEQVSREDQLRFKLKIDGDQLDDLISYNQLMEYLEDKTDTGTLEDGLYRFKCIKDHKGPYTSSDPEYNGSSYNLLIEWETGEQTWEPLSNIIASDPYTCAVYAKEHNLLNTPGWKLLKRHARTARRLIRTLKKSKYRQARASRKYKHGWEVPREYAHALQLDIHNGNNKWKEAIDLEIEQIKEYQVFKDFGKAVYDKNNITNAPKGHQKIRVHFVFDVKHCGKFKARLVADGHLTKEPMETVYSGVVSIRNLSDRIPSTTPGAEPPRDARDSGSARSHSMHLETSSPDRPKMVTYTESQTVSSYISVKFTRQTLRMPKFTRATHAQPSLSDFPWRDSEFWRADPLTRDDPGGTKFSHFPPK